VSEMSLQLQQLVIAGKNASRPTTSDQQRVFSELQARLGLTAEVGSGAVVSERLASSSAGLIAKTLGITVATLAVAVSSVVLVRSTTGASVPSFESFAAQTPAGVAVAVSATVEVAPPAVSAGASAAADSQATPLPASGSSRGTSRQHDTLSEEVTILSRAQTELHSGHAANALRLLAEHERRFSHGILAEERTAAKIQALCALGRVTAANSLIGKLSPQSLHGETAREACSSTEASNIKN